MGCTGLGQEAEGEWGRGETWAGTFIVVSVGRKRQGWVNKLSIGWF